MLRCRAKCYKGDEKFIFISYSHKDSERVFPIIERLDASGFRVWYDEGIDPGREWPEIIAANLSKASCVLAFISANSIDSNECRREISFALRKKINFLSIFLEEVSLSPGMEMQLSPYQAMFKYKIPTDEEFYEKLMEADILLDCRSENTAPAASLGAPHPQPQPAPQPPVSFTAPVSAPPPATAFEPKKSKKTLFIILGASLALIVLIAGIAIGLSAIHKKTSPSQQPDASSAEAVNSDDKDKQSAATVLSDQLSDFTFELKGVVYQLPCPYRTFTENGWTITSNNYNSSTLIAGSSYESIYLANDGAKINVSVINMSGDAKPLGECNVGEIECYLNDCDSFKIAKGITCDATPDEVKNAFGTPSSINTTNERTDIRYEFGDDNYTRFSLYDKNSDQNKFSYIEIRNFVASDDDKTQTNETTPEYLSDYVAPADLGNDMFSGVCRLEGKLYQLPAPISLFLNDGWTLASAPGSIVAGGKDSATLEKNGNKITVSIGNYAEYQTTVENCVAVKLYIDASYLDKLDFEVPGGLKLGLSKEDAEKLTKDAFTVYEGTYYTSYSYSEYRDRDFGLTIYVDKESKVINKISLECLTWLY